ncbi:unnamed protein product [Haemonchus placei]|uniref:Uncharacterized protein n=1 Tax=Haemonchus placei TaxID=6290 RepID=A0A0N4W1A5_HAEPC|nr:unnamed protein product [Haemonchus placei]
MKNILLRAHLFDIAVLPASTHASETQPLRKQDEHTISVIQRLLGRTLNFFTDASAEGNREFRAPPTNEDLGCRCLRQEIEDQVADMLRNIVMDHPAYGLDFYGRQRNTRRVAMVRFLHESFERKECFVGVLEQVRLTGLLRLATGTNEDVTGAARENR